MLGLVEAETTCGVPALVNHRAGQQVHPSGVAHWWEPVLPFPFSYMQLLLKEVDLVQSLICWLWSNKSQVIRCDCLADQHIGGVAHVLDM